MGRTQGSCESLFPSRALKSPGRPPLASPCGRTRHLTRSTRLTGSPARVCLGRCAMPTPELPAVKPAARGGRAGVAREGPAPCNPRDHQRDAGEREPGEPRGRGAGAPGRWLGRQRAGRVGGRSEDGAGAWRAGGRSSVSGRTQDLGPWVRALFGGATEDTEGAKDASETRLGRGDLPGVGRTGVGGRRGPQGAGCCICARDETQHVW